MKQVVLVCYTVAISLEIQTNSIFSQISIGPVCSAESLSIPNFHDHPAIVVSFSWPSSSFGNAQAVLLQKS
jgi:hypothetical protein